jgi:hypothetical protein
MRKITQDYDNPLDNLLISLSETLSPCAYKIGLTPNAITTLSNITCIVTIILLLKANYYLAAFFLLVSYFFDCLDGHMARKYKMTSVFGDYYDHISDFFKVISVLFVLYYINEEKFYKVIPIIVLIGIFSTIHLGCQELLYDSDESGSLKPAEQLCPVSNTKDKEMIKDTLMSTKYFGCGTFYLSMMITIIYYAY